MTLELFLRLVFFEITWWLGFYTLSRYIGNRRAVPGIVTIALALLVATWIIIAFTQPGTFLAQTGGWLALPLIGWLGFIVFKLSHWGTRDGFNFLPDFLRSFDFSFVTALLFAGQIALAVNLTGTLTIAALWLMLISISLAVVLQVFAGTIASAIDRFALNLFPDLRHKRAALRAESELLTLVNEVLPLPHWTLEELQQLTRRALSSMGDLPRLAVSPLARLPQIEANLMERATKDSPLERAASLKLVLTEAVVKLKPAGKAEFGTTDEWRYYNALYFPYVVGLKPYSQRYNYPPTAAAEKAAWNWFRDSVPERTLHNWQNAASRLVAQELFNSLQSNSSSLITPNLDNSSKISLQKPAR